MAKLGTDDDYLRCSFCDKSQRQVKKLIAGPGVYICEECVELCNEIIEEEFPRHSDNSEGTPEDLPAPREICAFLDDYVVGQESAKRVLAVSVYNHYKRVRFGDDDESDVELQKSNILLIGPTGCGKTLMAQTLARLLDVPFVIVDATALTEAGYVGEDVENILLKLVQEADYDIKRAQTGIVYIDEIDKIAFRGKNVSITRDVSGEGVQQALLKIIEGTEALVPPQGGRKHPQQDFIRVDTTDVLFICGGAFHGIEEVIEQRLGRRGMGFGADIRLIAKRGRGDALARILPEDLAGFGFIPEFMGRLPIVATVDDLDCETLVRILAEPRNALIKQYQKIFRFENVELQFTPDALHAIAEMALKRTTGARGLRAVLEEVLLDLMYDLPGRSDMATVLIDRVHVLRNVNPTLLPLPHATAHSRRAG